MLIQQLQEKISTMFSDLSFDEQRHLYFWKGKKVPKSVSAHVEDHAQAFDEDYWLPRCAIKEGVTTHELKHKWQTTNKEACDLGTETHHFLEHFDGLKTASTPQQEAGVKYLLDTLPDYEIVFKELRMYSVKYNFAGTADLLLRHRLTGQLVIADYKTNKDLFKTFGFLLPPFGFLECHPYNKYQLQLSYYQLMLNEIGISISERKIVYLKADSTYRTFNTIDFTDQLETVLNTKKELTHVTW